MQSATERVGVCQGSLRRLLLPVLLADGSNSPDCISLLLPLLAWRGTASTISSCCNSEQRDCTTSRLPFSSSSSACDSNKHTQW